MADYIHINHGFDPIYDSSCRILVLGSVPSVLSRENNFYYGNPHNRFWRVMAAITGTVVPPDGPDQDYIEAKKALLLRAGIALWDVIESCDIAGSSDASIRNAQAVRIERVTENAPIEVVFCNGGASERLYRKFLLDRTGLPAIGLPSTSPANAAWSLERLTQRWSEELMPYLRKGRSTRNP